MKHTKHISMQESKQHYTLFDKNFGYQTDEIKYKNLYALACVVIDLTQTLLNIKWLIYLQLVHVLVYLSHIQALIFADLFSSRKENVAIELGLKFICAFSYVCLSRRYIWKL